MSNDVKSSTEIMRTTAKQQATAIEQQDALVKSTENLLEESKKLRKSVESLGETGDKSLLVQERMATTLDIMVVKLDEMNKSLEVIGATADADLKTMSFSAALVFVANTELREEGESKTAFYARCYKIAEEILFDMEVERETNRQNYVAAAKANSETPTDAAKE